MNWIAVSAVMLALGVAAGAFGAHGLKDRLGDYASTYDTGALYHLVHAVGMLAVSVLDKAGSLGSLVKVNWLLFIGILVFSGSLYTLSITKVKWLGAITPIGGTAFIAAWVLLAYKAFKL